MNSNYILKRDIHTYLHICTPKIQFLKNYKNGGSKSILNIRVNVYEENFILSFDI